MIKSYRENFIYKFSLNIYLKFNDIFLNFLNYRYHKTVKELLANDDLEQKINELDEQIKSRKKNTYYIIRRQNESIGLLTYVAVFLGHIAYAVKKGYIPVIDMENFPSIYVDKNSTENKNGWELFFEQPMNIGLKDIPLNSNIIYSSKLTHPLSPFIQSLYDEHESNFWKVLSKKYIRLNEYCNQYYMSEYNQLIKNKKILGLLYRGTDYIKLKPKKHPVQPSYVQFIEAIESCLQNWGEFDYYYIATDDSGIVVELDKKFPGKIIFNKREYYDQFKDIKFLAEAKFNRENDEFLKGIEYLSSIKLLSNCDYIVAGLCAGTYAVNYMKPEKLKGSYFFNLGVY